MLDRIRRKLFLSVKVMGGTDNPINADNSQLGRSDIMDILRKGSSALSRADDGMSLARFLDAPISDILNDSRSRENVRDAKMKKELNADESDIKVDIDEKLLVDAEAEERALLSGVALVQSRLFEGKVVGNKNNKQIADEWQELQKRARVDRLVMIDGIAVIADHVVAVCFVVVMAHRS
jgi:SWI/SNF-related matrix-associated actin-dependent regulator of chromatin subfamily A member 5